MNTMTQSPVQQALLIAEREVRARLSSKAFVASIAILLIFVLGSVLVSGFMQNRAADDTTRVAVLEGDRAAFPMLTEPALEVVETTDRDEALGLIASDDVDAFVLVNDATPAGSEIVVSSDVPDIVQSLLTVAPEVTYLDPDAGESFDFIGYFLAIGFGLIFFMAAMTFGNTIVQSVVEEKQTRVIEILLSTVHPRTLLVGKILGNSLLAFVTIALAMIIASVGMLATGQDILLGELGSSLTWFAVLFIFGFLLTATLYAATASLVSRMEDAGTVTSPVMMLIMIPYFLVIFFFDNERVLTIMSYVPFSAPVGMPMRLYYGDAAWWEPILSLVIIIVTTAIAAWIGAKIYEGSILRTGQRVKLREALQKG